MSIELPTELETMAQRYAAQIIASRSEASQQSETFHSVGLDSMELVRPRRVGVEQLALHAAGQLKLQQKLQELGFNRHQLTAALGNIIAYRDVGKEREQDAEALPAWPTLPAKWLATGGCSSAAAWGN